MAAMAVSDRMITAGDIEYEPQQLKVSFITDTTLILIAGEYPIHSEALKHIQLQIRRDPKFTPENIAVMYGRAIQKIKQRHREDIFLAPFGLNTDTFLAQQKEMSDNFVASITNQLQDYRGADVEALVVGAQGDTMRIFAVDANGTAKCYDDVGFAAIGIGGEHARSVLMQAGYVNTLPFAAALAATYVAKKASEIAPGVGTNTDIHLVFKGAIEQLRDDVHSKVRELYENYDAQRRKLAEGIVAELAGFVGTLPAKGLGDVTAQKHSAIDETANGSPTSPTAETARGHETGQV
jgi:20S proteasome alpha/beta subunit